MYTFFTSAADLTQWQQQRVYAACNAFVVIIDPGFDAEPLDLDGTRVGWFYHLTTDETRRRLVTFFTRLVGKADGGRPYDDPDNHAAQARNLAIEVPQ